MPIIPPFKRGGPKSILLFMKVIFSTILEMHFNINLLSTSMVGSNKILFYRRAQPGASVAGDEDSYSTPGQV